MSYEQREEVKAQAWGILAKSTHAGHKAWAALAIIEAHYWRARKAIEGSPASFRKRVFGKNYYRWQKLGIDAYTQHWLAANGEKTLGKEVMDSLADIYFYEPVAHPMLSAGHSNYVAKATA